ncbi:glycosyltransferase family 4 protein [Scopulibacillus cellulosilyticus]|uniref:Glycosyltransferase family 4 protein n=1 Tax=Scopulibacillus cellulosilyticus TaxID=2665665 RepID=A0ABW2PYH0_9BACL
MQNIKDIKTFVTNNPSEIKEIINRENYQVIIVCSYYDFLKTLRQLGYRGKIIYELQGAGVNVEKFLEPGVQTVKTYADAILIPQTTHLIQVIQKFLPDKKVFSFHNCFDFRTFKYQEVETPPRPIIGWVGRLEQNKNWRDFIKISSLLKNHIPNLDIWMFEDASLAQKSERRQFQNLIQKLGISSSLTIRSNIPHEQMPFYYSSIGKSGGFLLSTSKSEGFGYAVVEAMSCRCPVLTTDSDGVKAFVIDNKTGKFFNHSHINQAVSKGLELILIKEQREQIIQNAWQQINTICDPIQYFNNFEQMLLSITDKTAG